MRNASGLKVHAVSGQPDPTEQKPCGFASATFPDGDARSESSLDAIEGDIPNRNVGCLSRPKSADDDKDDAAHKGQNTDADDLMPYDAACDMPATDKDLIAAIGKLKPKSASRSDTRGAKRPKRRSHQQSAQVSPHNADTIAKRIQEQLPCHPLIRKRPGLLPTCARAVALPTTLNRIDVPHSMAQTQTPSPAATC